MSGARDTVAGQKVGPYEIESEIASGGAGTVYRARSPDGEPVAVKVLHQRLTGERSERFEREAAMRFDHPNIIRVIESGRDARGRPYLALELLEGEPLSARLKGGPLSPRQVIEIGVQVCRGLEAAHQQGVTHRDIKPDNLFVTAGGTVKLLDFGIALVASEETRMTTQGMILGTPWYLSPEQVQSSRSLDGRVDVWALGAVLHEALSGKAPFARDTVLAVALAVLREEPEPLGPDVPAELAAVVERCLLKDREMRWPSARSLREALEAIDIAAASARPPPEDRGSRPSIPHGEQRVVAVLLADGAADLSRIEAAVTGHGGTFVPVAGRRAIGLFGGEAWEGDELERAALAAMTARGAAERLSVAAGRVSSDGRSIEGEVLRAVEESCRAGGEGVTVDASAARALTSRFSFEPLGKGLVRIVEKRPSTIPPAGAGAPEWQPAPLVGREAELAQIDAGLRGVLEDGRPLAMLVVGPAGIGKSRLHAELLRRIEQSGEEVRVLRGHAESRGAAALSIFADALHRRARHGAEEESWPPIGPEATPDERREALLALAREAIEDERILEESTPFLGVLLGVPVEETPAIEAARRDAQVMADRLRVALFDYFEGLARLGPIAVLIEDAHWADGASLDLCEELMERLAEERFLLFVTARPELDQSRPELLARSELMRIEPRGLGAPDVAKLARSLTGRTLDDALVRAITERTAGNPLFVEQIVLELADEGKLDAAPSELPLPVSVEAAVQSRLDHLPVLEKALCRKASVFGRPFSIEEAEGIGVADALGLLDALRRRGLIAARGAGRERERQYWFGSALFAEVAYHMLEDRLRAELHRRAAVVLGRAPEPDDEEVGSHHERGGEPALASGRYLGAVLGASRRGDGDRVLRCADRVLALGVPEGRDHELHMARADAFQFAGRFADQDTALGAAMEHARSDADRARVFTDRIGCMWWQGKKDDAVAAAEQAVARSREVGDPDLRALALGRQVSALTFTGKLKEASAALAEAESLAEQARPATRGLLAGSGGSLAASQGDLGEARRLYAEAAARFREAGDLRRAARNEMNLADTLNRFGAYSQAETGLLEAAETYQRVRSRAEEAYAWLNIAYARIMLSRGEDARDALQRARDRGDVTRGASIMVLASQYEALRRLSHAELDGLAEDAFRTAEAAAGIGYREVEARALAIAAEVHLAEGNITMALERSERAMKLRDELGGLQEHEAEIFLARAHALLASGRSDESERVARAGRTRVLEMAAKIGDEAWRRRFLEDVPAHRALMV